MFTETQLRQISALWQARQKPGPLNLSHLAELSRIVFFAGMQREEGRPVEVRISVLERAILTEGKAFSHLVRFLPLSPEPVFSVDSAVKLAGATDTRNSALIVIAEKSSYVVAGIAFFGWPGSYLDAETGSCPPPHALTLVSRQPGQLAIAHADGVIARFVDGAIIPVEATPLVASSLGTELERRIQQHEGFKKYPKGYAYAYTACLERLLVLAEARGHGGTILWVPKDLVTALPAWVDIRRGIADGPDIAKELGEILGADEQVHQVLDAHRTKRPFLSPLDAMTIPTRSVHYRKSITEHLAMLAQMTRVDGALVIDEFFRPLGFSAVIKTAPEWTGPVVNMSRLTPGPVDLAKFGTRHRSAVTFAANCAGAVALVISQDGAVRALIRQNDQVSFWPDCFGSVFLH